MTALPSGSESGVHRLSDGLTRRAAIGIGACMALSLLTAVALEPVAGALGASSRDQATRAATYVGLAGLLVPLWCASVLGGYAVHRLGWVPGLLLPPSVVACGVGWVAGGWWAVAGAVALVLTVGGFVLAGRARRVSPLSPLVPAARVGRS